MARYIAVSSLTYLLRTGSLLQRRHFGRKHRERIEEHDHERLHYIAGRELTHQIATAGCGTGHDPRSRPGNQVPQVQLQRRNRRSDPEGDDAGIGRRADDGGPDHSYQPGRIRRRTIYTVNRS